MVDTLLNADDTKRASEKRRHAVDFSRRMEVGDTVQSVTVTATDAAGASVTTNLIESPTASGTRW